MNETVDEIVDKLEASRLGPVSVDGNVFVLKRLNDEVRHHSAVVGVHARTERVENSSDANVDSGLALVAVHHRFRDSFAFVVAGSRTDSVDIAPVRFDLRMNLGVAVDFRSRSEKHARLDAFGETEHVQRAFRRRFDSLDRVVLVVRRAGWAGQVEDLIDFQHDGLDDVGDDEVEIGMAQPVSDILFATGKEIVEDRDLVTHAHEPVDEVGTDESGAAGDQNSHSFVGGQSLHGRKPRASVVFPVGELFVNRFSNLRIKKLVMIGSS